MQIIDQFRYFYATYSQNFNTDCPYSRKQAKFAIFLLPKHEISAIDWQNLKICFMIGGHSILQNIRIV